jgi:hypothetical protein
MTDADWEFLKKRWLATKNAFLTDEMRPQFEDMVARGLIVQVHIHRGIIQNAKADNEGK